jgi:hypothetical protein
MYVYCHSLSKPRRRWWRRRRWPEEAVVAELHSEELQ